MDEKPVPIEVDPMDTDLGMWLVPKILGDAIKFAKELQTEDESVEENIRGFFARLCMKDPTIKLWVFVKPDGSTYGHFLATLEPSNHPKWVYIWQSYVKSSKNAEMAKQGMELVKQWGRENGVKQIMMSTARNEQAMGKLFGFKTVRHLMQLEIDEVTG